MKRLKRIAWLLLSFVMLIAIMPASVQAKTVEGHTVFTKKQMDSRIRTIRDYYYNKTDQLKVRKQKIVLNDGGECNISYYIHGKDLMFGYGTAGKTEYRMYFYKNQLIQLLVDKPGKTRKTYTQLYKRLENPSFDDNSLSQYMMFENYARKEMEFAISKSKKVLTDQPILITHVSGNYIVYHKLYCYGPDGYIWNISKETYKAKITSNTKILDGSENPAREKKRSVTWLKKRVSGSYLGYAVDLSGSGNTVSKIVGLYFA